MLAEIITIGDELLIGQVIDTNSAWMAGQLNSIGIKVHQITSVSDQREHILQALKEASARVELIIMTGGLGPTKDDITKKTLCEYFDAPLEIHNETLEHVTRIFISYGLPLTELNRLQAMVPKGCTVLKNKNGTAPGMWFEFQGKIYISMPGVPFEMKGLMNDEVMPRLQGQSKQRIIHRTILTQGEGESLLAARIESWENNLPGFIKLAYLPQPGIVRLRLTATGTDEEILRKALVKAEEELMPLAGELIFGYGEETMAEVVGKLLKAKGLTLATAESCTGGQIAQMITSVAGSSDYFKGAVVAYSNEVKENILGVNHQTLLDHGAVSEATVIEMAVGVKNRLSTDYAIAVSGIAGPSGGTEEKPVGTTWIAISTPSGTRARHFRFGEHRERNIQRAALTALSLLRKELLSLQAAQ